MTQANNVAIESSQINSSGVLQPAGGGTGTTTSTGSGSVVLATSPTVTTPTIDKINTSVANTSLGAGDASMLKNRIINGECVVNQYALGTVTPAIGTATYIIDRWNTYQTQSSKFTIQQSSTAPAGFTNSLLVTSSSAYSVASGDTFTVQQYIEGLNCRDLAWGTANAKTVTLSFWVQSSLTGTFGGALSNSAVSRSYPFTYSIPVANTWTQISVIIAGDTAGTWLTTNGVGIRVYFGLGVGTTQSGTAGAWAGAQYQSATGATSVVGTNGATFYITGVQLEVGSSATGFEYRQYQQELALCQRYYWRNNAGTAFTSFGSGVIESSTNFGTYIKLPVTMRAVPTPNYSNLRGFDGFNATAVSSFSNNYSSTDTLNPYITASGAIFIVGRGAVLQANGTTSAWIDATAEL